MTQKTWWHLGDRRRIPSEYEVVSSRLLYHPERGFAVPTPAGDWYARYGSASPLRCGDWERFADPQETTYARYTGRQRDREAMVEGLLRSADDGAHDRALPAPWVAVLDRVVAPARYPFHALGMVAAYVGQMAPSGRVTLTALFQAADEVRVVHRLAYRLRQLQQTHGAVGSDSRATWEDDPLWQPLRELVERLLVAYDWGESLVALNLVVKPSLDELLLRQLAALARRSGDDVLGHMLGSFHEDARWHREWTAALLRVVLADTPATAEAVEGWIDRWQPLADAAVGAFAPAFEEMPAPGSRLAFAEVQSSIAGSRTGLLHSAGLRGSHG